MVQKQTERFRRVAMLDEAECVVGGKVCRVALLHDELVVGVGATILRVPVLSLVVIHMIVVETLRVATHVPLAHYGSLITSLLELFSEEGACGVDALTELALSVLIAVKTCHEACTRRCGERVLHESTVKAHATLCDAVDVGSGSKLRDGTSISADALECVVVAHYIYDVGALSGSGCFLLCLSRGGYTGQSSER